MDMRRLPCRAGSIAILAILLQLPLSSFAADFYIIGHSAYKLDHSEVREIYLGEKRFVESEKLNPVDNAAAQAQLLERVVKLDSNKYNTVWVKRGFRDGINPPPLKSSDAEVIEFVKRTPGAIGYVNTIAPGVIVIDKY